jgi:hypothetical protein
MYVKQHKYICLPLLLFVSELYTGEENIKTAVFFPLPDMITYYETVMAQVEEKELVCLLSDVF